MNQVHESPTGHTFSTAHASEQFFTSTADSVVVFFPSGNYNQVTELGRYKNLGVAMTILSSINHPDNLFQIPEYKIFSLETGKEILLH